MYNTSFSFVNMVTLNIPVFGVRYLGFCQYGNEKFRVGGSLTLSFGKPSVIVIFFVELSYLQLIDADVNPFSGSFKAILEHLVFYCSISNGTNSEGIVITRYEPSGILAFGRIKNLKLTSLAPAIVLSMVPLNSVMKLGMNIVEFVTSNSPKSTAPP